jgi:hypothetical protein
MSIKDEAGIVEEYFLGPVKTGKNIIVSKNIGDITFKNVQRYLINFTIGSQGNTYTIFTRTDPVTFTRTATTLVKQDGTYAINSTLSTNSPAYQALLNGVPYSGQVILYDKTYYGYYSPIFEPSTHLVIGAFFIAYPLDSVVTSPVKDILENSNILLSVITGPVETGNKVLITKNQGSLTYENYQPILIDLTGQSQCEYTLFTRYGDDFIRTTTSVLDENNEYAVGTSLSRNSPAYERILHGLSYTGEVILFGGPYYSTYSPMFDSFTGLVIGIYFSGYPF